MRSMPDNTYNSANKISNFNYGVVGLGRTGQAMIKFLLSRDRSVLGMDSRVCPPNIDAVNKQYPNVPTELGDFQFDLLNSCEELVLSPGVDSRQDIFNKLKACGRTIKGDVEIFAENVDAPVIGITGTNGKSTVTTIVYLMLKAAGVNVRCGGNLGPPAIELLSGGPPDCYVLELSSFQLELMENLHLDVACILNVTPDHLDRHLTFDSYLKIKKKILKNSKLSLVNSDDEFLGSLENGEATRGFGLGLPKGNGYGMKVLDEELVLSSSSQEFIVAEQLRLVGDHNRLNCIAALGIVDMYLGSVPKQAIQALEGFTGLPHRCQIIGEKNGVQFIDDSKATNVAAACVSILGMKSDYPIVLIAGGASKGVDYRRFVELVIGRLRAVVLIGETASDLNKLFSGRVKCVLAEDMWTAINSAAELAFKGDTVLLAPACSSLDMFEDYHQRGELFREAVIALGDVT